jgi:hypothetical protein
MEADDARRSRAGDSLRNACKLLLTPMAASSELKFPDYHRDAMFSRKNRRDDDSPSPSG